VLLLLTLVSLAAGSPLEMGLYEQSIQAMSQLLVNQDQPPIWSRLGVALSRAGRYQEALGAFQSGLGMAYETGPVLDHANALRGVGRCEEAMALRSSALLGSLQETGITAARVGLVDDALACERLDLAYDYAMEALAHDPESGAAHAALADVYQALGQPDDAAWTLQLAQKLGPSDTRVIVASIRALALERRWAELSRILPRLSGAAEREPAVFVGKVQLALAQNRPRDAAQLCMDPKWERHEDRTVQDVRRSVLEWLGGRQQASGAQRLRPGALGERLDASKRSGAH
jgi:tetratricopeptide (TPR) repeat protein